MYPWQHHGVIYYSVIFICLFSDNMNVQMDLLNPWLTSLQAFIRSVHRRQAMGYKINAACWFILRNKSSNRLRYFHPSVNNFRVLPNPRTIQSMEQLKDLLNGHLNVECFEGLSVLGHPTSKWVAVALTNVVLYLYYTHIPLIWGPGDSNDDNNKHVGFILNNQAVQWIPFETDNLGLFRCLALTKKNILQWHKWPPSRR